MLDQSDVERTTHLDRAKRLLWRRRGGGRPPLLDLQRDHSFFGRVRADDEHPHRLQRQQRGAHGAGQRLGDARECKAGACVRAGHDAALLHPQPAIPHPHQLHRRAEAHTTDAATGLAPAASATSSSQFSMVERTSNGCSASSNPPLSMVTASSTSSTIRATCSAPVSRMAASSLSSVDSAMVASRPAAPTTALSWLRSWWPTSASRSESTWISRC